MIIEDNRPLERNGQEKNISHKTGLEGQLEQLNLFQNEINQIQLTDDDLKDLLNTNSKSKLQKFYEKFKSFFSGIGIDIQNKKHLMRIIYFCMIAPIFSHTLAIGNIFKEDRETRIYFFAYTGGFFFSILFEFAEHVIGKFKHRSVAHIGSGIISICSYILSMLGWQGLYSMESDVSIFGIGFPIGIRHIVANIFSLLPPLAIYAFTTQLFTIEQEEIKAKDDKLKSGEKKKPYIRTKRFTKAQIENFLYELMANPNTTFKEFSANHKDVGSSKFDQLKAAARKKLREHQTNKQEKK